MAKTKTLDDLESYLKQLNNALEDKDIELAQDIAESIYDCYVDIEYNISKIEDYINEIS